uniref:HTH CENPB-type domain-containing protein n=1 Tax=Strigamia maritima TaxID=126957 RepID=T1JB04_STRMM
MSRETVLQLMRKKDEIEREITQLGEQRNVGMRGPLVDEGGYPRIDIDIFQVRVARQKIICKLLDIDTAKKKQDVAIKWNISASTLSTLIKKRKEYENAFKTTETGLGRKRLRKPCYPDLETALKLWFDSVRSKNVHISGDLIKDKALQLASGLGYDTFVASGGWLTRFKSRFGIACKVLAEESAAVCDGDNIHDILDQYQPQDIYNAAKSVFLYNLLPGTTLAGNHDRITVMCCCNIDGSEKRKLFVIGKTTKPKSLQNDHKAVMKDIEKCLHEIHAQKAENDPPVVPSTSTNSDQDMFDMDQMEKQKPFAKIDKIMSFSPAELAGLASGDFIIRFGSISAENYRSFQDISSVVQHSIGKTVPVTIKRNDIYMHLTLIPNTWSGRGLLGCNLLPL